MATQMVMLRLTDKEAEAVHTLFAVVLNDPYWFDDNQDERNAVDRADRKLVASSRRAAR